MSTPTETQGKVHHANESNFDQLVLNSEVPVLVDFYADWCGPCRMIAPALEELARENPDARIVKVNVDHSPRLAAQYGISSIPSLKAFRGGQVVGEHVGMANKAYLEALLGG
jgi:thioredoxin 1